MLGKCLPIGALVKAPKSPPLPDKKKEKRKRERE